MVHIRIFHAARARKSEMKDRRVHLKNKVLGFEGTNCCLKPKNLLNNQLQVKTAFPLCLSKGKFAFAVVTAQLKFAEALPKGRVVAF